MNTEFFPRADTSGTDLQKGAVLGCAPNKGTTMNGNPEVLNRLLPDEELNTAISSFQAELPDWKLASLSLGALAGRLHEWADNLWAEFLPEQWKGRATAKPSFLFLFQWEPSRILGHYTPGRNAVGCRWEISLNPANLTRLSEIRLAAVALHELLHCFEDMVGSAPKSRNGYHSAWLRKTAEQLGIPCTRFGCSCGIRPESPFSQWANRRGLKGTAVLDVTIERMEPAKQKRQPWICGCPAGKVVTAHVAAGSQLRARCEVCGTTFQPKNGTKSPFSHPTPNMPPSPVAQSEGAP